MNTNVLRKSLVVGVIFLFIGMNIFPVVGSIGTRLYITTDNKILKINSRGDTEPPITNILFNGTEGNDNWFISNVYVSFSATDNQSGVNLTYYALDGGEWTIYTSSFVVTKSCIINYYSVDNAGNAEEVKSASLKIDHGPEGGFAIAKIRFGKWFIYAHVYDSTSGMDKVEFYVEDILQGTVSEPPYLWICNGSMRFALVILYDKAGNAIIPQIPDPYPILHTRMTGIISNVNITEESVSFHAILVFTYHGILRDEQVTYPNSYVGYIGKFFMNAVFYP